MKGIQGTSNKTYRQLMGANTEPTIDLRHAAACNPLTLEFTVRSSGAYFAKWSNNPNSNYSFTLTEKSTRHMGRCGPLRARNAESRSSSGRPLCLLRSRARPASARRPPRP